MSKACIFNQYIPILSAVSLIIIPFISILISDYSAVYHDYLLVNKPIFFIPYDYDWYKENIGFLYDYRENMPGGEIENFQQMKHYLQEAFEGKDTFLEKRNLLKNKIHTHFDGKSSERVAKEIEKVIFFKPHN